MKEELNELFTKVQKAQFVLLHGNLDKAEWNKAFLKYQDLNDMYWNLYEYTQQFKGEQH